MLLAVGLALASRACGGNQFSAADRPAAGAGNGASGAGEGGDGSGGSPKTAHATGGDTSDAAGHDSGGAGETTTGGRTDGGGEGGVGGSVVIGSGGHGLSGSAGNPSMGGMGGMGGAAPLFSENFEDGDVAGWTLGFPQNYTFALEPGTGADSSQRSLLLSKTQDSAYCCEGFFHAFESGLKPSSVSFWMRAEQTGLTELGYFRLSPTANASSSILTCSFNGSSLSLNGPSGVTVVPFTPGEWLHLEFRNMDWQSHTFSYFVNGAQIGTAQSLPADADAIRRIDLYSSRTAAPSIPKVRFDEIVLR